MDKLSAHKRRILLQELAIHGILLKNVTKHVMLSNRVGQPVKYGQHGIGIVIRHNTEDRDGVFFIEKYISGGGHMLEDNEVVHGGWNIVKTDQFITENEWREALKEAITDGAN